MHLQKNVLHYYVDLLRMRDGNSRVDKGKDICIDALHNTIRTMIHARHNHVCAEDYTYLDWGTIPFNGINFSLNGNLPCDFSNSRINRWNFIFGLQDSLKGFFIFHLSINY